MAKLHEFCFAVKNMASNNTYRKYIFSVILCSGVCSFFLLREHNLFVYNLPLKNYTFIKKCSPVHNQSEQLIKRSDAPTTTAAMKQLNYDDVRGKPNYGQDAPYLQSISGTCNHYNLSSVLVKRHYLSSPTNKTLYCWIRKVASTSFTKLFSDLRNRKVSREYYKEVDVLSPKTIEDLESLIRDDKVFKFLVVRHPFERIVSSYRDRLEDNTKYTAQAWIYAQKIFHLTRPDLFRTNRTMGNSLSRIFNTDRRLKLVPIFKEFITWLLQEPTSKDDVHWDSYYSHCSVCNISYDYIIKLEDYAVGDMNLIFSKMGVNKGELYMTRLEETAGGFTDYQRTCSYFKALTRDMIFKLYQRYRIDFEMFNYKHEDYLECADSKI